MIYLSPEITIFSVAVTLALGLCFGSFLNCLAWRTVHGESVLKGRSHCDFCGHVLGAADLVPVFSYVLSGGKCRYCGKKLSAGHLWREIVSGAAFVLILLKFDISLKTLEGLVFASVLMACAFADLEEYIIPDSFIIFGCAARVIFIALSGNTLNEALSSLIGGAVIAGAVLGVVLIFEKLKKKEAMGGGDIKLLFMTGLYLGIWRNLLCVFAACIFGIVFGVLSMMKNEHEESPLIPWGPSIALSAVLIFAFGDELISAYLSLF